MQRATHKSLKSFNTFGIDVQAKEFVQINELEELETFIASLQGAPFFVLGGGSNLLLTQDFKQPVVQINLKGKEIVKESQDHLWLKIMAGENWHEAVKYCVEKGYGGIENLSLIPGNMGAAPIQNIGAYGVELKDVFDSCEAVDRKTGEHHFFDKAACEFGYRDSYFKRLGKDTYVIYSVTLKLTKNKHTIKTDYGAIAQTLQEQGISEPTIKDVSLAVIKIRESKLPNPKEIGNSGSFFKNPVIDKSSFDIFIDKYPKAPFYPVDQEYFKVPAGWLIEQAGFKGKRFGAAGVHEKQALVLVNHGKATGSEIWQLAQTIKQTVKDKFGIDIEPEVTVL